MPESELTHRGTEALRSNGEVRSQSIRAVSADAGRRDRSDVVRGNQGELNVGASARVAFQVELAVGGHAARGVAVRARQGGSAASSYRCPWRTTRSKSCATGIHGGPPGTQAAAHGILHRQGRPPGVSRLAVAFRQGGSELGVIGLAIEVVDGGCEIRTKPRVKRPRPPHDLADDDKLALLVEQRTESGQVFYEYTLHSEALGLPYRRLRSKPLLDRGGGPAATRSRSSSASTSASRRSSRASTI